MADVIIKKWNGTGWEEHYPKTTVGNIVATGTPSSTTFLRGDGTWSFVPIVTKADLTYTYVYGKAQSAITKGQAVQFAGVQGDHIMLKPAVPSEINANPDYFVGVADATVATNDFLYVVDKGELRDVPTNAFASGTILWYNSAVGATVGTLTSTEPVGELAKIQVGAVTKSNATEGVILIRVHLIGTEIEDIVAGGTASSTTFLRGDGTWATPASASGDFLPLTGGTLTGGLNVELSAGGNSHIGLDVGSSTFNNYLTTTANGTTFFRSFTPSPATYTTRMVIKGDGNVGIGNTSPDHRLVVGGVADTRVQVDSSSTQGIYFTKSGTNNGTFRTSADGDFEFFTKSVNQALVLKAGGNVGIGTQTPSAKLDVQGDLLINNPSVYGRINGHDTYHSIVLRGNISGTSSQSVVPNDSMTFAEYGGTFRFKQLTPSANTDLITLTPSGLYIGGSTNNGRIYADDWGIKVGTDSGHVWIGPANSGHAHIYTDRPSFYFNKDLLVNGSTVWHAGNFNPGSYLTTSGKAADSNLLDGIDSSQFVRNDIYNSANSGFQVFRNIGTGTGSWQDGTHTFSLENSDVGNIAINFHRAGYSSNNIWYTGSNFNFDIRTIMPAWSTSARNYSSEWIEFPNHSGLYSPLNNAHFYPNNNTYGAWRIQGSRNGWRGLEFDVSTGGLTMMVSDDGNTVGWHHNSYGWQTMWQSGTMYVFKNTYGGGTQATVLDSSNYNGYAPTLTGGNASGTWGINITGNSNSVGGYGLGNIMHYPGWSNQDANTQAFMRAHFTYSNNAPWTGPLIHFGADNYSLQLNASYGNSTQFSFRTRNGDNGNWHAWREIIHAGNIGSQTVNYASNAGYASSAGSASTASTASSATTAGSINTGSSTSIVMNGGTRWTFGTNALTPNTVFSHELGTSSLWWLRVSTCGIARNSEFALSDVYMKKDIKKIIIEGNPLYQPTSFPDVKITEQEKEFFEAVKTLFEKINIYTFDYKGHEGSDPTNIGFMAQEIEEILKDYPMLVNLLIENSEEQIKDEEGNVKEIKKFKHLRVDNLDSLMAIMIKHIYFKVKDLEKAVTQANEMINKIKNVLINKSIANKEEL
jgi:hypothetical protein